MTDDRWPVKELEVIGPRPSVSGHRSSVIGHRSSVIGHRSSVIGHRSSVIGHRSSSKVFCITLLLYRYRYRLYITLLVKTVQNDLASTVPLERLLQGTKDLLVVLVQLWYW